MMIPRMLRWLNLFLLLLAACTSTQTAPIYVNLSKHHPIIDHYKAQCSAGLAERCCPEFPFKDGWLGGDGDVSVPLDATTTLFLFSDSYVGLQDQTRRSEPGTKMVANTVAIQSCKWDDESEIHYFWNRMYTSSPRPVLEPKKRDHKFWVNDAFLLQGSLYVLLEEIGGKKDADPDDVFNFTQLGYTLAKIDNPYEIPFAWNIEYIPLPGFQHPLTGISCLARHREYIYFFINNNDNVQQLLRKAVIDFEDTDRGFEYYAKDGKWHPGIEISNMDTLFTGFRCNTVKYHNDIKKWVLIHDIEFKTNKIKMRISPEITGPWSEERVVYTIPETTPGNENYHENNFCYLARECIQNYNTNSREMVITYDVNNFDLSYVIEHENIYTPRVIRVYLPAAEL